MPRKGIAITLTLDNDSQRERLENLAIAFDATWGDNPNISQLIKMIADGRIQLHKPGSAIADSDIEYFKDQVESIQSALNNLKSL